MDKDKMRFGKSLCRLRLLQQPWASLLARVNNRKLWTLLTNLQRTSADSDPCVIRCTSGESNAIHTLVVDPNFQMADNKQTTIVSRVTGNHLRLNLQNIDSGENHTYNDLKDINNIGSKSLHWGFTGSDLDNGGHDNDEAMKMKMKMMMKMKMTMTRMLMMRMQESRVEEESSQASSGPRGKLGFSSHSLDQPLICSAESRIFRQPLIYSPKSRI